MGKNRNRKKSRNNIGAPAAPVELVSDAEDDFEETPPLASGDDAVMAGGDSRKNAIESDGDDLPNLEDADEAMEAEPIPKKNADPTELPIRAKKRDFLAVNDRHARKITKLRERAERKREDERTVEAALQQAESESKRIGSRKRPVAAADTVRKRDKGKKRSASKQEEDDTMIKLERELTEQRSKVDVKQEERPNVAEQMEDDTLDQAPAPKKKPHFEAVTVCQEKGAIEMRRIPIPPNRYAPLKEKWMSMYSPIVDHLKLQIRFNLKQRVVELRTCEQTKELHALQKGADLIRAFALGFDAEDALALVRLDDLYLESFQITDVKPLKGDHLSRAIGRLAGKGGRTKYTIENVTKTRIVLAGEHIHVLGSFQNIAVARRAICNLILGSPPSKVYGNMRTVAARMAERF